MSHGGSTGVSKSLRGGALLILSLLGPFALATGDGLEVAAAKIRFDLSVLDVSGLYGPPDGLRAVDYEFCIPDRPDTVAQVRSIDKSVTMHGARGRIGCSASELLCIGNTHQPGYREVLAALSHCPTWSESTRHSSNSHPQTRIGGLHSSPRARLRTRSQNSFAERSLAGCLPPGGR